MCDKDDVGYKDSKTLGKRLEDTLLLLGWGDPDYMKKVVEMRKQPSSSVP